MCFDFLYNFCLKYSSFYEELSDMWSKIYIGLHVQYVLFLSNCNETWIFLTYFRKVLKYQISSKSVQWELSCFTRTDKRTDRGTDMTMLIVAFRNFVKRVCFINSQVFWVVTPCRLVNRHRRFERARSFLREGWTFPLQRLILTTKAIRSFETW